MLQKRGEAIATKAIKLGIKGTSVVLGTFTGRIKALADAARQIGLTFEVDKGDSMAIPAQNSVETDGIIEKLVAVNRTAKVVKGGRVLASLLVVVGDGQGKCGFGFAKASEVPVAIKKAMQNARRNMSPIPVNGSTIYHDLDYSFGAAKVVIKPAKQGLVLSQDMR